MGRPRRPDAERRSQRIALRLSYTDLDTLSQRKEAGESLAGYIRSTALCQTRPEPVPEVSPTALQLLQELAQRINEAARAVHRGQRASITEKDLAEVATLLRYLLRGLSK